MNCRSAISTQALSLCLWVILLPTAAHADVHLPAVFSDHAVLQRDQPIHIWGNSLAHEQIQIEFNRQKIRVRASQFGIWDAVLLPEHAGGPYVLRVSGSSAGDTVERRDILVGDVWFASGQSNMEMPLKGFPGSNSPINGGAEAIASSHEPRLRLFLQGRRVSMAPESDTTASWQISGPTSSPSFSAIGYFFGRKMLADNGVPVGIIASSWGGTPAHSWISAEGIAWSSLPSVAVDGGATSRQQGEIDRIKAAGIVSGDQRDEHGKRLIDDHAFSHLPSVLFNGMVAPYTSLSIKGWLWYQGESDAAGIRPKNYSRLLSALIQDWRKQWGQGPLPFLVVQLSSFDGGKNWGLVRDAQRRAETLTGVGLVPSLDLGEHKNIHPAEKKRIALRLAHLAQGMDAGTNSGRAPSFVRATIEGDSIRAWLTHAENLHSSRPRIEGFEVAGSDHIFTRANAKIELVGKNVTIIAKSQNVILPYFIRYASTPFVESYLYNTDDLPLGSFTSESDASILGEQSD